MAVPEGHSFLQGYNIAKFERKEGTTLLLGTISSPWGSCLFHDAAWGFSALLASAFTGTATGSDTARTTGKQSARSQWTERNDLTLWGAGVGSLYVWFFFVFAI